MLADELRSVLIRIKRAGGLQRSSVGALLSKAHDEALAPAENGSRSAAWPMIQWSH